MLAVPTLYGVVAWKVETAISAMCARASREFPGDRVEMLIAYVSTDTHTPREKNRAVWVLGELRDTRALPALEVLLTGRPCDHDREVCQYEVKKAIKKIDGEIPNPYFWRWN